MKIVREEHEDFGVQENSSLPKLDEPHVVWFIFLAESYSQYYDISMIIVLLGFWIYTFIHTDLFRIKILNLYFIRYSWRLD